MEDIILCPFFALVSRGVIVVFVIDKKCKKSEKILV